MSNIVVFNSAAHRVPFLRFKNWILLILGWHIGLSACAQWSTSGSNISNTNTGNVGIGTTTLNFLLDVNGAASFGGSNSNLDASQSFTSKLTFLQNSGKMLIGWNRQAGSGETDLISNSGAGSSGGFAFWNYTNGGTST